MPTIEEILESYKKQSIAIRYFMIGRRFDIAVAAMNLAAKYHTGTRKDGITPEFMHQVEIANYVRTLPVDDVVMHKVLAAVFVHDLHEDYDVSVAEMTAFVGEETARHAVKLSKMRDGSQIKQERYYAEIAGDVILALAKGSDRVHNVISMQSAFSPEKQLRYVHDTERHVMPMLKDARRAFPAYEAAFENIKHVLMSHIELIRAIHTPEEK